MNEFNLILKKFTSETGIRKDKAFLFYDMFVDSYDQNVKEIEQNIKDKNYLLKLLHQIKGSAVNLRLDNIVRLILIMEQYVREQNVEMLIETVKASVDEVNKLKIQIDEYKGCYYEKCVDC